MQENIRKEKWGISELRRKTIKMNNTHLATWSLFCWALLWGES